MVLKMLKIWFYKRQLKYWERQQMSLELELEFANIIDGEEVNRLMKAYKEYETIIDALKLLIHGTTKSLEVEKQQQKE